ncbi:GNAT family N-acetyltransferase [Streptomyces sp. NPDC006975]|uniref:GNAT family N-acetyltransferase n=1 Tax=Streptomyces sp. NPDC006975 TaxID=3154310 RepID=UPI00345627A8
MRCGPSQCDRVGECGRPDRLAGHRQLNWNGFTPVCSARHATSLATSGLCALHVSPKFRRMGVARALVDELFSKAGNFPRGSRSATRAAF